MMITLLANILAVLMACSHHVTGIPLENFYPFGSTNGDNALLPNDDGSSGPINLSIPFIFFNETRPVVFVS